MPKVRYSLVLPIYNEAESLPKLFNEITQAFKGKPYEIIAVNDHSTDQTLKILQGLQKQMAELVVISFPKRLGKWAALREGIAKARGQNIITLDADLQDDPAEALRLISKLKGKTAIVSGWRKQRRDVFYKRAISTLGNQLISTAVGRHFYDINSPLKIYRRVVLNTLPLEGSLLRFSLLFAYKMGYRVVEVPISHRKRKFGYSKFGVIKYMRIVYDLVLVLLLFRGSGRIVPVKHGQTNKL